MFSFFFGRLRFFDSNLFIFLLQEWMFEACIVFFWYEAVAESTYSLTVLATFVELNEGVIGFYSLMVEQLYVSLTNLTSVLFC
jgi:hypothetical protein